MIINDMIKLYLYSVPRYENLIKYLIILLNLKRMQHALLIT